MKLGIYYAYWEKEWTADYIPYVQKVRDLGFDILEVGCGGFDTLPMDYFHQLGEEAASYGITLTGGYGPRRECNLASDNAATVENGFAFYQNIFPKMQAAGISSLGGGLYSYWPVDTSQPFDKEKELDQSVRSMRTVADIALEYGIALYMEALNRFEGYLINDVHEAIAYVNAVDKTNVKILLDTFHMNIEEESFEKAILAAGQRLGELHLGEPNRRPPRQGRMPWQRIIAALEEIDFDGPVVMEPFVQRGGQVGTDIKVWRDLGTEQHLDQEAAASVRFIRSLSR